MKQIGKNKSNKQLKLNEKIRKIKTSKSIKLNQINQ